MCWSGISAVRGVNPPADLQIHMHETIDGLKDQRSCPTRATCGAHDLSRGPGDRAARFLGAILLSGWDLFFHRSQDKGGAK